MFRIKRGLEYFKKFSPQLFQGEVINIVTWTSEKTKATVFSTVDEARQMVDKLNYDDIFIVESEH